MAAMTRDQLRESTLRRQFPDVPGSGPEHVVEVFRRLGPIQSQVPRAPFLTAATRLPGTSYATMVELFEAHRLVKASTLRGTVHTAVPDQYALTDALSRRSRALQLNAYFTLRRTTVAQLADQAETSTAEWTPRAEVVAGLRNWLAAREDVLPSPDTLTDALLWGHSGLLRRPPDTRWETRTDTLHRDAQQVLPGLARTDFEPALVALVKKHLGSYGPASRDDLLFFHGIRGPDLKPALAALADELVEVTGPDGQRLLDLAEPPAGGSTDPGVRLLPEFDGLMLGFRGRGRDRFLEPEQLSRVWAKTNGLFSPVVLCEGHIVATWKTLTKGKRTDIQVTMLEPYGLLGDEEFTDTVDATERALNLKVTDLRVLR